jgi:diguanylate cyclase (GGDEF)-like protein
MPGGGYVITYSDITERKKVEEDVWYQAHHDGLTDLVNRSLFLRLLNHHLELAGRNNEAMTVLFVDLDGFKDVNDTYGHSFGDLLLRGVADRLRTSVRKSDVVARFGGDEFVILLFDVESSEQVGMLAEGIVKALSQPFELGGRSVKVSASVGIALRRDGESSAEDMVVRADQAMYAAKLAGKGCHRFAE